MRKTEIPHNAPEQVREYLQGALDLVDELEIPDELAPIAFSKAIDLLAAKQLFFEQATLATMLPQRG